MKIPFSLIWALSAMTLLGTLTGCADMISSLREESAQIDEDADRDRRRDDGTEEYRAPRKVKGLSANNVARYETPGERYRGRRLASRIEDEVTDAAESAAPPVQYRRVTRDDFVDKKFEENSLWDAQGQANYLFANNRRRETGDLVTTMVEKDLRREIQYQLWLTLPPEQRRVKRAPASAEAGEKKEGDKTAAAPTSEAKAKDAAEEAAKTNMGPASKDDDVVRMEVVESLGNGLVRVVGQKRVIYKGVGRLVEVVGIVNNKDIDDNNIVKSGSFLDTKAQVVQ